MRIGSPYAVGPRPVCRSSTSTRRAASGNCSRSSRSSVCADHVRALAFCIHENVRPGPEKQGYVIRRLLRRAVLESAAREHPLEIRRGMQWLTRAGERYPQVAALLERVAS